MRLFSRLKQAARLGRDPRGAAPVLLYHSVDSNPPDEIRDGLHNVDPDRFYQQVSWLQERCKIVSIDQLAAADDRKHLAAVTFDDGYLSVFENALPVLRDLNVPATIFVNGCTFEGRVLWRDKVRYLINAGLVKRFEEFAAKLQPIPGKSFYRYTKDPSNNSQRIDSMLDDFLASMTPEYSFPQYCVSGPADLVNDSLISYGNHTQNHYVMSSLSVEQQRNEIATTKDLLESIPDINISRVFSIPFGGKGDFDNDTLRAAADMGYEAVVLSRFQLNRESRIRAGVKTIERFMPEDRSIAPQLWRLS